MIITDQVDALLVFVTWPASRDPRPFAQALVEERLAACVNILPPMESVYRWKDGVEADREQQILIKTRRAVFADLAARIRSLHPYEVPEILALPVAAGDEAYLRWLTESVSGGV